MSTFFNPNSPHTFPLIWEQLWYDKLWLKMKDNGYSSFSFCVMNEIILYSKSPINKHLGITAERIIEIAEIAKEDYLKLLNN